MESSPRQVATEDVESPCRRHCCLNEKDVCLGCYRTLDEILAWSASPPERKAEILELCQQRRESASN
nr:DUF1289 domain-containing protein [Vibrio marisflavi]